MATGIGGEVSIWGIFPGSMDAARIAMYGAAAFTIVLVGAVIYDEIAPPPTPDNAREVADFCLGTIATSASIIIR